MKLKVSDFPENLFITGTDTAVGKTLISAVLMSGLNATYWKPIQSGLEEETDTSWIQRVTQLPSKQFLPERYLLSAPLSPHESSRLDGIRIDMEQMQVPKINSGKLIIEGAGGVFVPINEKDFIIDLMKQLNIPILIIASSQLGTINHTLLRIKLLRDYKLKIFGVVLNGDPNKVNKQAIEKYGKIPVVAEIPHMNNITSSSLKEQFHTAFL